MGGRKYYSAKKASLAGQFVERISEYMESDITVTEMAVEADKVLSDILTSYQSDFAKHAEITDISKIQFIWDSLPSQLARENKKFLYSAVKQGARARGYENALN